MDSWVWRTYSADQFYTFGIATYAGARAAVASSLRLTAAIQGLWTSETTLPFYDPVEIDFDGLSMQFGLELGL